MGRPAAVIGAESQWDSVIETSPHALALLTPPSARIGARGFARAWARHLRMPEAYLHEFTEPTMDEARTAVQLMRTRPPRMVVLEVGAESARQQNAVLKSIEEIDRSWVVVIGSRSDVLPTVLSRCMVVQLGLLESTALRASLVAQGMDEARAIDVANRIGVGSMEDAHELLNGAPTAAAVANVARALVQKDRRLLEASIEQWDEDRHRLFMRWLVASAAGRPLREVGSWQLPRAQALPLWKELCSHSGARPSFVMAVVVSTASEQLV